MRAPGLRGHKAEAGSARQNPHRAGDSLRCPAAQPASREPQAESTMAALASRANTNWPMRSFSSGWIDRTASSHSARLGSQVPQEKAQRTPSMDGTIHSLLAGNTMRLERTAARQAGPAAATPPTRESARTGPHPLQASAQRSRAPACDVHRLHPYTLLRGLVLPRPQPGEG